MDYLGPLAFWAEKGSHKYVFRRKYGEVIINDTSDSISAATILTWLSLPITNGEGKVSISPQVLPHTLYTCYGVFAHMPDGQVDCNSAFLL